MANKRKLNELKDIKYPTPKKPKANPLRKFVYVVDFSEIFEDSKQYLYSRCRDKALQVHLSKRGLVTRAIIHFKGKTTYKYKYGVVLPTDKGLRYLQALRQYSFKDYVANIYDPYFAPSRPLIKAITAIRREEAHLPEYNYLVEGIKQLYRDTINFIFIYGQRGVGKEAIVRQLFHRDVIVGHSRSTNPFEQFKKKTPDRFILFNTDDTHRDFINSEIEQKVNRGLRKKYIFVIHKDSPLYPNPSKDTYIHNYYLTKNSFKLI